MNGNCTNGTSAPAYNQAGSVLDMWPLGVMICGAGGMTSVVGLFYLIYDWNFTCKVCRDVCCNCRECRICCYDCYYCLNGWRRGRTQFSRRSSHWRRRREEDGNQRVEWEVVNTWTPNETKDGAGDEIVVENVTRRPTVLCTPICATTETVFVETIVGGDEEQSQAHRCHAELVSEL
ncbi:Ba172 [Baboon cytomegalovirus]|nr:Ba172 [Baboon cytomegalovirus]